MKKVLKQVSEEKVKEEGRLKRLGNEIRRVGAIGAEKFFDKCLDLLFNPIIIIASIALLVGWYKGKINFN